MVFVASVANPCGPAGLIVKFANAYLAGCAEAREPWCSTCRPETTVSAAAVNGIGLLGNIGQLSNACFAAGTPLLTADRGQADRAVQGRRHGSLGPGGRPGGPGRCAAGGGSFGWARMVEGWRRRASDSHDPRASVLRRGQGLDEGRRVLAPATFSGAGGGRWTAIERVADTNEDSTVYNLRVEEYHTYFVGTRSWGFSDWTHNAEYGVPGSKFNPDGSPKDVFDQVAEIKAAQAEGKLIETTQKSEDIAEHWLDDLSRLTAEEIKRLFGF